MKKNRSKKLFCFAVAFAMLFLLCLGTVCSAWSFTDAPFYNYFDNTKIHTFDSYSNNGYVSNVNPYNGQIALSFDYNGRKGVWTVPYSITEVTLRDLCPEIEVGDTYILGGSYDVEGLPLSPLRRINLYDGVTQSYWYFGEAKVVTAEMLDSRITYNIGTIENNDTFFANGTTYTIYLTLWINKGTTLEEFAPHDLTLASYQQGFEDGYQDGLDVVLKNYEYILSSNVAFAQYAYNSNNELVFLKFLPKEDLLFTGNLLEMKNLPSSYYEVPDGYTFAGFGITIHLLEYDMPWQDLVVRFQGKWVAVESDMVFYKNGLPEYYYTTQFSASIETVTQQFRPAETYPLPDGAIVGDVAFRVFPQLDSPYDFTVGIGNTNDLSFEMGYANGLDVGFKDGYTEGEADGLKANSDYAYQKGYEYGLSIGSYDGYYKGRADEANQSTFFKFFFAILDAPVQVVMDILDFEIFGTNLQGTFVSVISLVAFTAVAIWVIKIFV